MGGGAISYNATIFVEPDIISEEKYIKFKTLFEKKIETELVYYENYFSKFKLPFIIIAICFLVYLLSFLITYLFPITKGFINVYLHSLILLVFIGTLYNLILEGHSYLDYVSNSKEYFLRMKYSILKSKDYKEFYEIFYTIFKKDYDKDFRKWKSNYYRELKKLAK